MRGKTAKRLRKAAELNSAASSDPRAARTEYKRLKREWKDRNKNDCTY